MSQYRLVIFGIIGLIGGLFGLYIYFTSPISPTKTASHFNEINDNVTELTELDVQNLTDSLDKKEKPKELKSIISKENFNINVQEFKTKNGFKGWLVENHKIPIISVAFAFKKSGYLTEARGKQGLINILELMLMEGCAGMNAQEFARYLIKHNIELNFSSSRDNFYITIRTIKKNLKPALQILKTVLTNPNLEKDSLKKVKNQLLRSYEELKHNEKAVANLELKKFSWGQHPSVRSPIELIKALPNIDADHLLQFIKNHLTQDHVLISAAGSTDSYELSTQLDDFLKTLPKVGVHPSIPKIEFKNASKIATYQFPIPQSIILFTQPGINRKNPKYYAALLANEILGGSVFESRLWKKIREEKGLAYGFSMILASEESGSYVYGGTATKNETAKEVINLIQKEWSNIRKNNINEQELEFTKKQLIGSYPLSFNSTQSIAMVLLNYQVEGFSKNYINKRNQLIQKVKLEEVNQIARELFNPDHLVFVVVGQPNKIKNAIPLGKFQELNKHSLKYRNQN